MTIRHPLAGAEAEDNAQAIAEMIDEMQPTRASRAAAAKGVEACMSTTQMLLSLADWHEEHEDAEGAELLRELAREFAAHEVTTL